MGHIVKDPETRSIGDGKIVVSFTLAVPRRFSKEKTDFIPVTSFGKTAEFVEKYFHKGQQVAVCGSLQINPFKDKEGNNRYSTAVVSDEVYFADSKKEADNTSEQVGQNQVDLTDNDVLPF
jgi:single-strand DNA-binding protein